MLHVKKPFKKLTGQTPHGNPGCKKTEASDLFFAADVPDAHLLVVFAQGAEATLGAHISPFRMLSGVAMVENEVVVLLWGRALLEASCRCVQVSERGNSLEELPILTINLVLLRLKD